RTPLTLILGPLEDLDSDDKLPPPYRKKIKTIHSSALQLLNLINQILEFRKAETHNRRLTVSKGQIASVVAEIGLRYKELNHNERVSINLDIDNSLPEIYFDSDVIHTVLNNLLSNAIKYTPEGSIELRLRSVKISNEDFVEIEVADTGYGIDENSLPHIFDRYYQAEGMHQASGTGIGLALVRSLSNLHEGTITATSEVGKGTVFTLRLRMFNTYPNALHKDSPARRPASVADENEIKEISDRQLVALVVEDNDDIREYIESSLQSKFKVLTATNGEDGLNLAKSHIPDVIISDIMMPMMDGTELCKSVKDDVRTSHIPVILLTAKDSIQDKETGYEAGADSYITKPFSAKLLASRIQNILDSRKSLAAFISSGLSGGHSGYNPATTGADEVHHPKISKLDECFIQKFTRIVEDNLTMEELDMTYIQDALGMSHSTLYRKIKGLTGMSGNEFIRKIRLKKGYELLEEGHNVSEAAYSCGFNDVGHFRNCFKNEYGMSPSQFIKQNNG
ncbi:MAG TPA: hybrid sensor histidine kinase/response regulator, partial [Rikenellaceae bacterium]|nr:hybrid sensor histidine kinase/response regulator [Rikenellaceae bacterium]